MAKDRNRHHKKTIGDAITEYKKNPTKQNLGKLVEALRVAAKDNPTHLHGGYYRGTKDYLSRSDEMYDRGNKVRGVLGYLTVPAAAIGETVRAPFTALARSFSSDKNLAFDDTDDLAKNDPSDVAHNVRAANELKELLTMSRPDPTSQMESVAYFKNQLGPNKERVISDSALRTAGALATLNPLRLPYVGETLSDVLAAPHTALMNSLDLNGTSREEYEEEKRKEKELSKKACTVLDLMRLVR